MTILLLTGGKSFPMSHRPRLAGRPLGKFAFLAALGATSLALPQTAHAQSAKASAEALFAEGLKLMDSGKVEAACPKFADSQTLDPSSGTLLNLASCYEKLGRTASAWATYQEAASLASSGGRNDHVLVAQKRAKSLLPTLSLVIVSVPEPVLGLVIRRDEVTVTRAEWDLAVPVDPGPHTYRAEAPNHRPVTLPVVVAKNDGGGVAPARATVTIPALVRLPRPATVPLVEAPVQAPASHRPQRTAALIAGGVGLVGLGLTAAFAVSAKARFDASLARCPRDENLCTAAGVEERDGARFHGNIATATFVVGALGLALGAVLWVTAPSPAPGRKLGSLEFSPSLGGGMVRVRW
jgi:hypothetical protein